MLHLGDLKGAQGRAPRRPGALDWPRRFIDLAAGAGDPRLRAFYACGVPSGDTVLKDVPMVALDVETTGLDPAHDEIVSIGVVPMTLGCIASSASRYWVVRPRAELQPESVTIHAITHAQIDTAPDLGAIVDDLLATLAGRAVVVHCREIERTFLDLALKARIGEGLEFPVIDTMALEARLHRQPAPSLLARLFGRKPEPVSIRLADSRARYRLPRYRAHHALTDALATAELLQAQVAHRFSPDTPLRELWL
ncbi:MAG: 3'-5' exonuclease [Thauera propionica]|jgi:DNA polymerase-3 subunit epsilon|uniref:3'-5' exonuclease n=1 Tax=Thauera propionica TaxID=2019431 RepID=UPI0023F004A1|nr:3'-5' exonuclease [Thauera propionica]MDD3673966.1 3'-5' exonuclease [Thauera propionica]MDY0045958.1 3'-5' exonuclease [Thauera propionica]